MRRIIWIGEQDILERVHIFQINGFTKLIRSSSVWVGNLITKTRLPPGTGKHEYGPICFQTQEGIRSIIIYSSAWIPLDVSLASIFTP